ncbi:MAG: hypothetical protein EXR49_08070 [Dehalococcoidia bacterium]|nr:hypothetical protein [Dehalococcoidia bacterium]
MGQRAELRNAVFLVDFLGVTNDSRCPIDVVCIRANAVESQDMALVFPTPDKATAHIGAYCLAVTGLAPAPRAGQPIPQSAYVVTLLITPA